MPAPDRPRPASDQNQPAAADGHDGEVQELQEVQEVFAELIDASAEFGDLDASQQDAWVSGMLASWRIDIDVADPPAVDLALRAWCQQQAGTEPTAARLTAVLDRLLTPASAADSEPEVTGCWLVEAAGGIGGSASAVLGFQHHDESEHCLLAEIDDAGSLIDLHVGPSAAEVLPDVETLTEMGVEFQVHENDAAETAAFVADAWRHAVATPAERSEGLVLNQVVARARLRLFGVGELPDFVLAAAPAIDLHPDMTEAEVQEANERTSSTLMRALASLRGAPVSQPADGLSAEERSTLVVQAGQPLVAGPEHLAVKEREALAFLEWADWLGVMIGVGRTGAGAPMTGSACVDWINRCPEVTTSISKRDRKFVAYAFEVAIGWWADLGLVADGKLTPLGHWVLPRAAANVWGVPVSVFDPATT